MSSSYEQEYRHSIEDPETYWKEAGMRLEWIRPYTKVDESSFDGEVRIRWYSDGVLNAADNCVDRHARSNPDATALLWVADEPGRSEKISYGQLRERVNKFANILVRHGVKKGDRVTIYLPMIPEAAYAMLACARIGAVHSVVFAGFSAESLANRIQDAGSRLVITADEGRRGGKTIPLKRMVDEAVGKAEGSVRTLVVRHTGGTVPFNPDSDSWLQDEWEAAPAECASEPMNAEDPLFILYTSGSTGKPKGLVHTTGGYLAYASFTHERVFDYRKGGVYWCTADVGWITGHSYLLYGPLANGATSLLFEGVPNQPTPARIWEIVDEHKVEILYTAPTLIRALMAEGKRWLETTSRESLRILGTVGEPINPEAWRWYHDQAGEGRCPVVDTWWQTETGGIAMTPLPETRPLKPGAAMQPFFGICPEILDENGVAAGKGEEGRLVITRSWPGQARTIYGDHARFVETYFSAVPGAYLTGDGARQDEDGAYWIIGRIDDVVNVSGHRFGTAEIESALITHPAIAEAAAVGVPHPIKGHSLFCYVVLRNGATHTAQLAAELKATVRNEIGPIAVPDEIRVTAALPKTRSGKIMRRIVRAVATRKNDFGDISTLLDPTSVEALQKAD
jgi:acetyl-CoA synthetase